MHDSLPQVGVASLAIHRLWSDGHIDPEYPPGRPGKGRGTMIRGAVSPGGWAELFVIHWWGRNFTADAGDPNYGSAGQDRTFYRAERKYTEIGVLRGRSPGAGAVRRRGRWHRSTTGGIAFFGNPWIQLPAAGPGAVDLRL